MINGGTALWMVYKGKYQSKMDDLGAAPFMENSIYLRPRDERDRRGGFESFGEVEYYVFLGLSRFASMKDTWVCEMN